MNAFLITTWDLKFSSKNLEEAVVRYSKTVGGVRASFLAVLGSKLATDENKLKDSCPENLLV